MRINNGITPLASGLVVDSMYLHVVAREWSLRSQNE